MFLHLPLFISLLALFLSIFCHAEQIVVCNGIDNITITDEALHLFSYQFPSSLGDIPDSPGCNITLTVCCEKNNNHIEFRLPAIDLRSSSLRASSLTVFIFSPMVPATTRKRVLKAHWYWVAIHGQTRASDYSQIRCRAFVSHFNLCQLRVTLSTPWDMTKMAQTIFDYNFTTDTAS